MRRLTFILFIIVLSSCAAYESGKIAPGYKEAFFAIRAIIFGNKNELLTQEIIQQIPYASSVLKIGRGNTGLIILESIKDETETWVSSDGIYLLIKQGRIIQTAGLDNNLTDFIYREWDFQKIFPSIKEKRQFYYSYDNPRLVDLEVEASLTIKDKEEVKVFETLMQLYRFEETIINDYLGWKKNNIFWVDDSGYVWKSQQNISPKLPTFYIEVTKKPAY